MPNANENFNACMNNLVDVNICINFNNSYLPKAASSPSHNQYLDHDGHVERVREVIRTN